MKKTKNSDPKNTIGPRVREARLGIKPTLSQDGLAGRLAKHGISMDRSAISRIESRDRYVMDYEAIAIAKCLKVSVGYLVGEL